MVRGLGPLSSGLHGGVVASRRCSLVDNFFLLFVSNLCQHTMISSRASWVVVMRKAKQEPNEKARFAQYLHWFEQQWLIVV